MMRAFALLKREFWLLWRGRARLLPFFAYPLLVLLICVFAIDTKAVAPQVRQALVLIALVLSQLTLLTVVWRDELNSGVLTQVWLNRCSLLLASWIRYIAYMIGLILPLLALVLLSGSLLLHVPLDALGPPALLGTPTLLGLALLASALTVGLNSHVALPALLLLPLYVPVIILMALATSADPAISSASLYWLGALAALSFGLLPLGIAAALRQALAFT